MNRNLERERRYPEQDEDEAHARALRAEYCEERDERRADELRDERDEEAARRAKP